MLKKIVFTIAFLTILAMLGVFNRSEASSFSSQVEVSQPGHKFGGRKILKKKNKRNRKLLRRNGIGHAKDIRSGVSC